MRDYRGVSYDRIEDLKSREAISTIDEFLRQLSFGIGNLNNGKRADSSGRPTTPVALDDYFYLPGRSGGQLGHGGNGASDPLTLASTRHATKGSIYFGTARQSAFDELNNRFGVGAPIPEVGLHINKQPADAISLAASSDITPVIGDTWSTNTTSGFAALATAPSIGSSDDTDTLYGGGPPATTRTYHGGLDGTATAATNSWTFTFVARRSGDLIGSVQFQITRSDGTSAISTAIDLTTFTLTYATYTAVVSSGWTTGSGAAFTPNSFTISLNHQNGTPYLSISRLRITPTAGSGLATSVTLFERPAISTAPYSVWRDESDITVASITSTGAGQFQNVLLEDPGSGTGTISLIAPTGVTPYALTLPLNDGDANELLQTNGSGTLDFVTLSGDASIGAGGALTLASILTAGGPTGSSTTVPIVTWDAKGRLTAVSSVAIAYPGGITGFAIPTVDVDVLAEDAGSAGTFTALRSDARLQLSQAITPTWLGAHTWTRASDATALLINSFSNAGVNPLLSVMDATATRVRLFAVDPSGTVSISDTTSALTGSVKFQVRAPSGQSLNIAQILLAGSTVWSIGSTGKMVTTTLAPQFNFTGATASTFLTSTDTAGNTAWRTLVAGDIPALSYVTSVTGTANRITSSGGLTPAIDISAAYIGQTSITTLGTITTGTWSATTISIAEGGTGQTTAVAGFDALATVTSTAFGRSLLPLATAAAGRTLLELVVGTNVQAWDENLDLFAGLVPTADRLPYFNASGPLGMGLATFTSAARALLDDATVGDMRTTLGLGALATLGSPLGVVNGGTGTATAFTLGSVVFAGASGVYTQDNANLFWDDTNNWLGVGGAPSMLLDLTTSAANVIKISSTASDTSLYYNNPRCSFRQLTSTAGNMAALVFTTAAGNDAAAMVCKFLSHTASAATGVLTFMTSNAAPAATEWARLDQGGNFGLATTAPTNILSLGGNSARTMWMERHTTANIAGNSLTIQSGGATSGATDKSGGNLILQPGIGTGSSIPAQVNILAPTVSITSGTTDQTNVPRLILNGTKNLTSASPTAVLYLLCAQGQMTGGTMSYMVTATDGTNMAAVNGLIYFTALHKPGAASSGYVVTSSLAGTEAKAFSGAGITLDISLQYNIGLTEQVSMDIKATLTGFTATTFRLVYNVFSESQQTMIPA